MKRILFWIMPIFLLSCASGGMYKSAPCDDLQGQALNECLRYLPSDSRTAEKKDNRQHFPTQDRFERRLQAIDEVTDGLINSLFY